MNTYFPNLLNNPLIFSLIIVIGIIDISLKGYALWMSAQSKQKAWFICIFIFNTLGILPLIYILTHKSSK